MNDKIVKTQILKWMRANDYIELQAMRGQIKRTDKKYLDYIENYTRLLEVLRSLDIKENNDNEGVE